MQQGLRAYVQDENAMAPLHRPLKGGGGLGVGDGGNGGGFAGKGASSMPSVRKALGNITNSKAGLGAEGGAPLGKTPAGAPSVRRALGDITNSNAAVPSAQKATQKAPLTIKPAPVLQQRQPLSAVAVTTEHSRLDVLAAGGVERRAGHSWEQLEASRLAREDAEAQARLAALANFSSRGLPNFFPSRVRHMCRCWEAGGAKVLVAAARCLSLLMPCVARYILSELSQLAPTLQGAPSCVSAGQHRILQKDVLLSPLASPVARRHTGQGSACCLHMAEDL